MGYVSWLCGLQPVAMYNYGLAMWATVYMYVDLLCGLAVNNAGVILGILLADNQVVFIQEQRGVI